MKEEIECERCGKKIIKKNKQQRYCSKCSSIINRENVKRLINKTKTNKTFYSLQITMELTLSQKFKLSITLWAIILFIVMFISLATLDEESRRNRNTSYYCMSRYII